MEGDNPKRNKRREILKGLAGIPVVGGAFWSAVSQSNKNQSLKKSILDELNIDESTPNYVNDLGGDLVKIGIIGFGIRGPQLCRAIGYATNSWMKNLEERSKNGTTAQKNSARQQLKAFYEQENLNVKIAGVCDVFDIRADEAVRSFSSDKVKCKRYRHYQDMLASSDIDAVIIATPDHWHAPMAIDALQAGKHVYLEKPMTHNITETYELRNTVRKSKAVFAVGHQHRQTQSFITAQDIIKKNVLGHISLIESNTNRNSDNGAWQYYINPKANPSTIDWGQFLGSAPKIPFNKEHFFRWRKWWAYGSGLSGDLMTHDFDRINCVMNMGLPSAVVSSGGIYTHRDGREVPDVVQVTMDYPHYFQGTSQEKGKVKGMSFLYSATLGNQYNRGTVLMGHDATMELGNSLKIYADPKSTRYKDMLENDMISTEVPMYSYNPKSGGVDGITSATAKYFADKGLLWTYRDGKRIDSTHLHLKEWLNAIKNKSKVSCGIDEGFEEAISAHMAGLSYKIGRKIEWDPTNEKIIALPGEDLDAILLKSEVNDKT
ncbi:MAG TPA: Gfo/Idh/MocA family protein [Cyclobacteriaceae bacterium]